MAARNLLARVPVGFAAAGLTDVLCLEWIWALSKTRVRTYLLDHPLENLSRDDFERTVRAGVAAVCRESGVNMLRANFDYVREQLEAEAKVRARLEARRRRRV